MAPLFKKISFLFVLVLFGFSFSQPNIYVKNDFFEIVYSQNFEQPLEIKYDVLCNSKSTNYFSRKGLDFYTVPNIHTSDNADYIHNDYDKGHMAPAADFNCNLNSLKQTFSYVNCALQHKDLNRGQWKDLEAYEKELAITNKVSIEIVVDFTGSVRNATGAMVPVGFSKIITLNGKLFKSYYFPNQSLRGSYEKFLVKKY